MIWILSIFAIVGAWMLFTIVCLYTAPVETMIIHKVDEASRKLGINLSKFHRDSLIYCILEQVNELKNSNPYIGRAFIAQYIHAYAYELLIESKDFYNEAG